MLAIPVQNKEISKKNLKRRKKKLKVLQNNKTNKEGLGVQINTASVQKVPGEPSNKKKKLQKNKKTQPNIVEIVRRNRISEEEVSSTNGEILLLNKSAKLIKNEMEDNSTEHEEEGPAHDVDIGKKLPGSKIGFEILSNTEFSVLEGKVSKETLKAIEEMGFTNMTEIQAKAIPPLLEGRDLIGNAKTGSGKTLAFLIPAIELLTKLNFRPRNGTGCIILSPTRELAMQTFGVVQELIKYHELTYGLIMGGANRDIEAKKLGNGINVLVATPGRLVDHLQNTPTFVTKNLQCFIIDEADRILDIGFEEELKAIIKQLPKRRQTMLFSATSTKKTEDLIRISVKAEPVYVGVHDALDKATVHGLKQGYVVCPTEKKFLLLFTFLKKNRNKKVMVFFSTCNSVKYHEMLLNYIDLPVISIHGKQLQTKRTTTFFEFCNAESGILLCTDVAARGLDIPAVDWIFQYDPPDDPQEYIHRVGRTARGEGGSGHALLLLRPEELGMLSYLNKAKVPISQFDFSWKKVSDIQLQLEKLLSSNYALHLAATDAFKAYIKDYDTRHMKSIFDINDLDTTAVAKAFGLTIPPRVDLTAISRKKRKKFDKRY